MFAGDRRVWRVAASAPCRSVLLTVFYCLRPRFYYTGTDSVEDATLRREHAGARPLCVPGLEAARAHRPRAPARDSRPRASARRCSWCCARRDTRIHSDLPPLRTAANRISNADFPIPQTPAQPGVEHGVAVRDAPTRRSAWAGTPLSTPGRSPPTLRGVPASARQSRSGTCRLQARGRAISQRAGAIFQRAAAVPAGDRRRLDLPAAAVPRAARDRAARLALPCASRRRPRHAAWRPGCS